ncbi:hypothetical protein [Streptomyces sp. NPDC048496]
MPRGSLLVLHTDGLVESSEREIEQGMTHFPVFAGMMESWRTRRS